MKGLHNLGGFSCIGATRTLTLQPIPDIGSKGSNNHLSHLLLEMRLDITTIAGGSVTVRQLYDYLHSLNIQILGRPVCTGLGGWDLRLLDGPAAWQVYPTAADPAVVGAGVANAIRTVRLWFPFEDPNAIDPSEGDLPAKLLNEASQISVNTLAAAAIGTNATVNACDLTFWAMTVERSDMSIPSLPMVGAADVARFSTLPGGVYSHLFLVEPVAHFAAADITTFRVAGDLGDIIHGISTDGIISAYNAQRGAQNYGSANRFADVPADYPFIPLVFPELPQGARLSRLVPAMRGLQLDIQGAAAAVHAVWVRREPSTAVAPDALRALGVADPSGIAVAPQSGPGAPSFTKAEKDLFLGRLRVKYALTAEAAGGLLGRVKVAPLRQLAGKLSTAQQARVNAIAGRLKTAAGAGVGERSLTLPGGQGAGVWMVG